MKIRSLQFGILAIGLVGATSARAGLSVTIEPVMPNQIVDISLYGGSAIGVYAGVYNLMLNGVYTHSFCIDVFDDVYVGEQFNNYIYSSLAAAPPTSAHGPMGPADATIIEKLWTEYFPTALSDSSGKTAAALQVAIWETLVGANIKVSGNDPVTSLATTMLGSLTGVTPTGLEAIVNDGTSPIGQSYVLVPEPTTVFACALLLALPLAAGVTRVLRRNRTG